nr:unnamed protein product [Spirometra erinaceieuropaei]
MCCVDQGVCWNAKVRIRPSHPPAASLVSGLLDPVLTPGSGEGGGEILHVDIDQILRRYQHVEIGIYAWISTLATFSIYPRYRLVKIERFTRKRSFFCASSVSR